MKNIKYYISVLMVALSACSTDLVNPNQFTTADFWKTSDDAQRASNAMYSGLLIDGTYKRLTPMINDIRSDDATSTSPDISIPLTAKFLEIPVGAKYYFVWQNSYASIWKTNQVLENVPNISMDQDIKNRILGEAYFLRGLYYFNLLMFYNKIPLITSSVNSVAEYYPSQAAPATSWNQIVSDFQKAKDLLPATYSSTDKGRATKGAATGMLGKAYLYQKKWPEAAAEFKEVIDGGLYSLVAYKDNFTYDNENNAESLFEVQFSTTAGGTGSWWQGPEFSTAQQTSGLAVSYSPIGWNDVIPRQSLYNEYTTELTTAGKIDPRTFVTFAYYKVGYDEKFYGTSWPTSRKGTLYIRKYTNNGESDYDGVTTENTLILSGINYRVLRYADILMMYAEALNEQEQTASAYPYIQQVRDRASLPDLATTKPGMTQAEMRDQIAHERRLEFAFEGNRFNDIVRWGWLYDATKLPQLQSNDTDFSNWTAGREYCPIPLGELNVNKNLKQNDGY